MKLKWKTWEEIQSGMLPEHGYPMMMFIDFAIIAMMITQTQKHLPDWYREKVLEPDLAKWSEYQNIASGN